MVGSLDAVVLGRILVLQSALNATPDGLRVAEAVVAGLRWVPGVRGCLVWLASGQCAASAGVTLTDELRAAFERGEVSGPADAKTRFHALRTSRAVQGVLMIEVGDPVAFQPYEPFVANTANLVALHLESDQTARQLQDLNRALERQSEERAESLVRSEERFRTLFAMAPLGVLYHDATGRVIAANPAAERILNRSADQMLGGSAANSDWGITCEDGSPCAAADSPAAAALRTGRPVSGVVMGIAPPGLPRRWLLVNAVPEFRPGEVTPYQVFVTFTDITEQQTIQQDLRESEGRFRTLFESAPTGSTLIDPQDQAVLDCNEVAARSLGYTREEFKRLHLTDYEAQRGVERICAVQESVLRGEPAEFDTILRTKTGELRDCFLKVVAVNVRGRQLIYGAMIDITERKAVERELARSQEQLRQLNLSLETTIRQRTAQLEAVNEELKSFSYSVSHDLAAPLRGIGGWTEALIEDCGAQLDERAHRYLGRIRSETKRIANLTAALLQLSRLARAEMSCEPIDLSLLVETIANRLRETYPARRLEFLIEPGLTDSGNSEFVEIALVNLMDNAAKFTSRREKAVIEFGRAQRDGERVYFVRDNGAGFDMTLTSGLFGAFQRLHKESDFPGTGIGLATVKRIIQRHGGRIWAEAKPTAGATFYFTLGAGR